MTTEIGRLCATINQMAEALAETERMKNDFISSVSHELRTPLTSIKGWVETVAAQGPADEEVYRRGMAVISAETDRLYAMVEDLLDFSRLQNGVKLDCQVLDLVAEATDAALFIEPRMQKEGLRLIYEEPPEPYPVWADPARPAAGVCEHSGQRRQVFPPRRVGHAAALAQRVHRHRGGPGRGQGIAPDDLEKVRLKFSRAETPCAGPASAWRWVDEIVRALGGTLDIASTWAKAPPSASRCRSTTPGRSICTTRCRRPTPRRAAPPDDPASRPCGGEACRKPGSKTDKETLWIWKKRPEEKIPHQCGRPGPDGGHHDARPQKDLLRGAPPRRTIDLSESEVRTHWYNKIPLVRGVCNMADNLYSGYKYLMHSADISMTEEEQEESESKLDKWLDEHASPAVTLR